MSAPPLTGAWHDQAPDIAEAARVMLRLSATDPDLPRLEAAAYAACAEIDGHLNLCEHVDRVELTVGGHTQWSYAAEDVPAPVMTAAVQLTGELFRRKDAPFGVLNAASANSVPLYVSRDVLAGVLYQLAPYREGWGFA
jgi:hypothetical protein